MTRRRHHRAGGSFLRLTILVLLGAGPFLAGAVHEVVFIPLLVGCGVVGGWSWWRAKASAPEDLAPLPGARVLLVLHGLVLFQLLPLPMALLRILSPGSHAFYQATLLIPTASWHPISVSPPDTLRGLAFLAAFSLLYLAIFREMSESPWRRRLLLTVVGVGLGITIVAFIQAVSSEPHRIYGLWRPNWDWAVFGPYVNRSHFAGYLLLATPLAIGFAMESLAGLRSAWRRRRFLVLGDPDGTTAIRTAVVAMVLVAGLVAAGSRGAIGAFFTMALLLPLAARHRRRAALTIALLAVLGVAWIGLGGFFTALEQRGIRHSRIDMWVDMLPMVKRFPVFGTGLNAFSTAYPWYQTFGTEWVGEAHDEYLQALLDTGLVGASLFAVLLALAFRHAFARARLSPLDLGILGALLGLALHNLVDFNWQIPANAATWIALAALASRDHRRDRAHDAA